MIYKYTNVAATKMVEAQTNTSKQIMHCLLAFLLQLSRTIYIVECRICIYVCCCMVNGWIQIQQTDVLT